MIAALILALALDLSSIRNEPNPDRRSELALDNANAALDTAKDAYTAGDTVKMQAALEEVAASAELAYDALASEPHRNTKAFKKAEQRTHGLIRRLEGFREMVDFDSRARVDKIRDRVAVVNDNLLNGIMKKK